MGGIERLQKRINNNGEESGREDRSLTMTYRGAGGDTALDLDRAFGVRVPVVYETPAFSINAK